MDESSHPAPECHMALVVYDCHPMTLLLIGERIVPCAVPELTECLANVYLKRASVIPSANNWFLKFPQSLEQSLICFHALSERLETTYPSCSLVEP
jgi:hypothetical protein